MNRHERPFVPGQEAAIDYGHGEFRVVRPGNFVRCAVSGAAIRLEDLKYWSVERQEAYASPAEVLVQEKRLGRGMRT
jgi:hypothetical protein